jgi:hypothetical protein
MTSRRGGRGKENDRVSNMEIHVSVYCDTTKCTGSRQLMEPRATEKEQVALNQIKA